MNMIFNWFLLVLASSPESSHPFILEDDIDFTNLYFIVEPCPRVFCLRRFKNGQGSGLDGGQYRAHINGTLEIKRARAEDEGTYTCVANSILGTAENQVRLEVKGQTLCHHTQTSCFDSQRAWKWSCCIYRMRCWYDIIPWLCNMTSYATGFMTLTFPLHARIIYETWNAFLFLCQTACTAGLFSNLLCL